MNNDEIFFVDSIRSFRRGAELANNILLAHKRLWFHRINQPINDFVYAPISHRRFLSEFIMTVMREHWFMVIEWEDPELLIEIAKEILTHLGCEHRRRNQVTLLLFRITFHEIRETKLSSRSFYVFFVLF